MILLFDLISLQDKFINGGAEYTLKILEELILKNHCELLGLLDKKKVVPEYLQEIISSKRIKCFYIQDSIEKIVLENKVDKLYIGIAQRYNEIDLTALNCKIVLTCHDVGDLCNEYDNKINSVRLDFVRKHSKFSFKTKIRNMISILYHIVRPFEVKKYYENFAKLITKENVFVITVSNYSLNAINYFFDSIYNPIRCYYAPLKDVKDITTLQIENNALRNLIESKKKYFLLLNCERYNKNAALVAAIWEKFCHFTKYEYYAVFIGKIKYSEKNIVQIDSLSGEDLEFAYKNAYALLYPSVTEGFGYPPIEAMKFGTPVLCSNVTSIPEVCGENVLYFSPYYPEDLFRVMLELGQNRETLSKNALEQYKIVSRKQEKDFDSLINDIINI